MTCKRHKYPVQYKALLHFDYPYPDSIAAAAASNGCGGLRDEIGLCSWDIVGSVRFVGTEAPAIVVPGTPKFGWRCPQFGGANDYIRTGNTSGIWKLNSARDYELDLFVRSAGAAAGNILALRNSSGEVFVLSKTGENKLRLLSETFGIDRTAGSALQANVFSHVTVRLSQGAARVFLNSVELFSQAMTPGKTLDVSEVRLGGFVGEIDEFRFAHAAGTTSPAIPTAPFQGRFNVASVGGFGTGTYGDASIATAGNVQINSYAEVTAFSGTTLAVGSVSPGLYGEFSGGDEVMIHLSAKKGAAEGDLGFYAVRRISSIHGNTISLDRGIDEEFSAAVAVRDYRVQLVKIPNYKTLTVGADAVLVPLLWDGVKGGLVALKTTGDCTIQGKIITEATGPRRTDSHALTHTDIAERFILTGNVFIACGGTLRASENSRIGAAHPGDGKGTVGFGGNGLLGGNIEDQEKAGKGGAPGWGGKGGQTQKSFAAADRSHHGSGGGGGGGARGVGGDGENSFLLHHGGPGYGQNIEGFGGSLGGTGKGADGLSAPNVLLVCKTLNASSRSISTGGAGGGGGGGGGSSAITTMAPGAPGGNGGACGGVFSDHKGKRGAMLNAPNNPQNQTPVPDGVLGNAVGGGAGASTWVIATGEMDHIKLGGSGGTSGGAGYGGSGGNGGQGGTAMLGYNNGSCGGSGGGGAGTGFCYIAYEEMI